MQHHRHLAFVVAGNVFSTKTPRHREIDLHRATLPRTTDGVLDVELDLRPVKSPLARQLRPLETGSAQALTQRILGLVPDRVGADTTIP